MMRQIIALFHPQNNKQTTSTFEFHKGMTIKGKKNSKVRIVKNEFDHVYWGNIFCRKRIMSEYFSDSAFGSQSDTKKEFYEPWNDQELMKKLRMRLIALQYEYNENECVKEENEQEQQPTRIRGLPPISFMNDPNDFPIVNNNKDNNKNKKENVDQKEKEKKVK